jgi:uncharacterized RDD family membrane protein YckC
MDQGNPPNHPGSPDPVVPSTVVDPVTPSPPPPVGDVPTPAVGEAPLGARLGGFLIDFGLCLGVLIVLGPLAGRLATVLVVAYLLTRDALPLLDGQSIGKKALKIRAVTLDGRSLSGNWSAGLLRNAVLFIPFFPLVELIVLLAAGGRPGGLRRLGDQWAQTKVVVTA